MEMLTIVEIARGANKAHGVQAQSGREACWLEGWIELPGELKGAFNACGGYCELEITDGVLSGIVPDADNPMSLYEALRQAEEEDQRLKGELASTDYRVLKCYEASLLGQELPYDVAELTAQRQALRDAINAGQETAAQAQAALDEMME